MTHRVEGQVFNVALPNALLTMLMPGIPPRLTTFRQKAPMILISPDLRLTEEILLRTTLNTILRGIPRLVGSALQ